MPHDLHALPDSPEAVKAMVGHPQDRQPAPAKPVEALGGKLHHIFFAFGSHDVLCLAELPDDTAMAAAGRAAGADKPPMG